MRTMSLSLGIENVVIPTSHHLVVPLKDLRSIVVVFIQQNNETKKQQPRVEKNFNCIVLMYKMPTVSRIFLARQPIELTDKPAG